MGKTTDVLMTTAKNTSNGKLAKHELDDILSMGERTSVRIFATALRNNGVDACYFDPMDSKWPIITDDLFQNANPIVKECEKNIKECILPLVEKGIIPVIAGFVGKTKDGKITTLGQRRKRYHRIPAGTGNKRKPSRLGNRCRWHNVQ